MHLIIYILSGVPYRHLSFKTQLTFRIATYKDLSPYIVFIYDFHIFYKNQLLFCVSRNSNNILFPVGILFFHTYNLCSISILKSPSEFYEFSLNYFFAYRHIKFISYFYLRNIALFFGFYIDKAIFGSCQYSIIFFADKTSVRIN